MPAKVRDMTQQQFDAACERWGFRRVGFLGYYEVGYGVSASILNRTTRREQLKFLIESKARARMDHRTTTSKARSRVNPRVATTGARERKEDETMSTEAEREQRRQALIGKGIFAYCTCHFPLIPRNKYAQPTENCGLHRELAQRWNEIDSWDGFYAALDDGLTRLEQSL